MYHHHPPTNPVSGSPPIHPHVYSPVVDDQYILPQHGLPYYAPQYPLSPSEYGAPMAAQFDFGYDPTVLPQFYLMPDGTSHGSKGPRRRRSGAGAEPIKHRRTRSGCFTCRARRVKVCFLKIGALGWLLTLKFFVCSSAMKPIRFAKVSVRIHIRTSGVRSRDAYH